MGLTRVAITRPVFMLMLMLLAVLMGTIAFRSMRLEQNPDVQFGAITVSTPYPGAGPEEVNTLVSRKIEEAISGVNGLLEVTSTSLEGISTVAAQFNVGTNMDQALNDVRAKVDAILNSLPNEVEKPTILKIDSGSSPVMTIALSSDRYDNQQLRDLTDDKLADRFARIDGVASVNVSGGEEREIQIQIRKDSLLKYGLGVVDMLRAVKNATINVPSGRLVTGQEEYSVRLLGEFKTVDEIKNLTIPVTEPGRMGGKPRIVRLSDVATITDTTKERRAWARLNGKDTVRLTIAKAKEGNAIEIAKGAQQVIQSIDREFGIKSTITYNEATTVSESLFDLNFALFFGIALVALIVYVFLHNLRGMLIVCIAIPICVFATFIVLWGLGFTINNMSMLALSLAVGVLVDDAIVVLENIYRHLKMGEEPIEAAINGRSEIGLAAIAITLADVVVFIPIAFMGGIVGQFFKPLGIGFAVAVLLSLFVSFTITPMLASRWYRKGEDVEHPTGWFARSFENGFKRLENAYRRVLEWSLAHRWFVFCSGFTALVGVFMMIAGSFAPSIDVAIQSAMGAAMGCVSIALIAFGVNYFKGIIPPTKRLSFGIWLTIIGAIAGSFVQMKVPPPINSVAGMVGVWVLGGAVALLLNIFNTHARSRMIASGAAFGAALIGFSIVGFLFAQWKQEAIFKFQFMPQSDSGQISIKIELPPGASLDETLKVVEYVEGVAQKNPNAKYVLSSIGTRGGGGFAGSGDRGTNYAEVSVTLNDKAALLDQIMFWKKSEEKLRHVTDTSVVADLIQEIGKVPGANIIVSVSGAQGFGAPIQMSFRSEDRGALLQTVSKIRDRLAQGAVAGVISPDISSKPGKPEIRAIPDRTRLADFNITAADIANAMRSQYEGDDQTKFRVQGREYPVRVMMDLRDRNDVKTIEQLPVAFVQGKPVYLKEVSTIERGVGVDKIERRSREEEIRLTADLLPGYAAGSVQQQITKLIEDEKLVPESVTIKELGQADVQARESGYLFTALFLGVILVYMLLASLFNNLLYPFIIQLAQPQAMVGALLALIITDKALNIVGFVGIIVLVGLVGKNAILLVDYTNTLRGRGRNRHDALVEAGPVRLRPILMTTSAIILGMLPVALAIGRGSEFRSTIGITIIGGVILSTILTLVIIPCSYTIFDDLSESLIGKLNSRRNKGQGAIAESTQSTNPYIGT